MTNKKLASNTKITTSLRTVKLKQEQASQYARNLIESSLDPLVTISPDGKITDVNEAAIKVTGVPRDKLIGTDFSNYFTEPEKAREGYRQVFAKGSVSDYPLTIRHKDGRLTDVLYNASVYRDVQGKALGVFAAARDVTERKRAEEELRLHRDRLEDLVQERTAELRQTRDYLENLFNYANAPIICWDTKLKITRFNRAFENFTGYKADEVIARDLSILFPKETKDESLTKIKRSLTEFWEVVEIPILRKDGNIRIALWNSANVYAEDGRTVQATIAQGQDITERKLAEDALKESEIKYRIVADNTYDFEFWIDPHGKYVYVSPSCKHITGFGPEKFISDPALNHKIIHPDDRELFDTHSKDTEKQKSGELEFRIIRADGETRWMSHACLPVFDDKGIFLGTRGSNRDITERKRAEDALRRSNENLEQFAYVASHDLQEPLRMMASYSELLEKRYKGKLDNDADEFIGYIVDGAKRMQKLINDLLAYSRVGRVDKAPGEIDCSLILDKVINSMSLAIKESGAAITHNGLPTLTGSETNFIQLFQNFISNAIKFRAEKAPHIHIDAKREPDEWVFSISDNGIGIDPKYKDKIFLIFQRLHSREKYPGTGIGLSICKKIVESQGGRIWIDSELGKGATFYFTVPVNRERLEVM